MLALAGVAGWIVLDVARPLDAVVAALMYVAALFVAANRPTSVVPLLVGYMIFNREIRRLMDWGFGEFSQLPPTSMVVPAVAVSLAILSLRDWRRLPRLPRLGVVLILASFGYGMLMGVIAGRAVGAAFELLGWLSPVALFVYVLRLGVTSDVLKRWLVSIALMTAIAGAYGWFQWSVMPPWSAFWIEASGMGSIGRAVPFESRFFGPFGAPGAMGQTCAVVVALLLMFRPVRPPILWPLCGFLTVCSLASMVRSAWLTAALCLVVFAILARPGEKLRLIVSMAILLVGMLVALPLVPQGDKMVDRMSTLGDVQSDGSFRGRVDFSGYALREILQRPQGYGLGSTGASTGRLTGGDLEVTAFDNGFLQIPFALGLPGALMFGLGLFQIGRALARVRPATPADKLLLRATVALAIGHFMALAVSNFFKSDNAIWLYVVTACALAIRPPAAAQPTPAVRR